jgi:hypothetical protein
MHASIQEHLYRRPDLIAFSSPVSFVPAYVEVDPAETLLYPLSARPHNMTREHVLDDADSDSTGVALAAEAIGEVGDVPVPLRKGHPKQIQLLSKDPFTVVVSEALGIRRLSWSEEDLHRLFQGERTWEVEISLTITDDGRPEFIFMESGSGDARLDRDIIHVLSRPELWGGAKVGRGLVLISYSPLSLNGGANAH